MSAPTAFSLQFVDTTEPGIARVRRGRGFTYRGLTGAIVRDTQILDRIVSLAIPPAWNSVWICPSETGHIQATGRDQAGRLQYIYHSMFRAERDIEKFARMPSFAKALPRLRRQIAADMARPGLQRPKVIATVAYLLDRTHIRVGNRAYAKANKTFGASTLLSRHARITGDTVRLSFKGKSGKEWNVAIGDKRVARVIRSCQELPGQLLFQYQDDEGGTHAITSQDINAYLREVTKQEVSAKDFRTWNGTVLCAVALASSGGAASTTALKRVASQAVKAVASQLRNTPAVCRSSYIHPAIWRALDSGSLELKRRSLKHAAPPTSAKLSAAERAVLALVEEFKP